MGLGLVHAHPPDAAAPLAPAGHHYVAHVAPVQPGAQASLAEEGGCFATWAEALAVATGGEVRVDPKTQPHALTPEMFERFSTARRTIIAVDYADAHFEGVTLTWYADQGCAPGVLFNPNRMPEGWNDRVSSVVGAGGCDHQFLYEHIDFNAHQQGLVAECHPQCEGFRLMENKTSSRIMAD
jgi:hypothetical protein